MAGHKVFADPDDAPFRRVFGGEGGTAFNDAVADGDLVQALWLASGARVDSVQIQYRNGHRTSRHGGTGGMGGWVAFEPGEQILSIAGWHGAFVERLEVRTTHRLIGGGTIRGTHFAMAAPEGHHIAGFRGRCGLFLDAIGICLAPVPPPALLPLERARSTLRRMPNVDFTPLAFGDDPDRDAPPG